MACTFFALRASVLEPKIDRTVAKHRQVRGNDGIFESRPKERMKNALSHSADLSQPRPQEDWRYYDLIAEHVMGSGRIAKPSNIVR
jgi:hypothetical protein